MSNEIATPYDRVLIDPNEPLILPDGTAITGRLETFLYALCCLDYDNLPTPLSRIEEFANALITGEIPNIEPQSRSEQFFLAILDGNIDNLLEPQSRSEVLLNKLAVGDFDLTNVDPIQSRYELLLAYLIKNGGVGNLDYILYEFYQATQTLYNTQEKPVKSAILKGQTLVNILSKTELSTLEVINPNVPIKQGTDYTLCAFGDLTQGNSFSLLGFDSSGVHIKNQFIPVSDLSKPKLITTFTFNEVVKIMYRDRKINDEVTNGTPIKYVMIEGDHTDKDITYFEGMKSVQMPVLKTTGKNLFDVNSLKEASPMIKNYKIHGSTVSGTPTEIFVGLGTAYIPVKKGEPYTVSCKIISNTNASIEIRHYNDMSNTEINNALHTETTNSIKTIYPLGNILKITLSNGDKKEYTEISDIQIEEGLVTTYEPYKSIILTVNEEVTLRSNGDVYDELNLLTGRLTQRIDENNEVLAQEVVKTVDLSVIDQDGNVLPKIKTFNDTTHVNVSSDGTLPKVEMEVATYNEEDIANANVMTASMDEIYSVQNELDNTNSIQSEEIDSTMIASTEIYENIL